MIRHWCRTSTNKRTNKDENCMMKSRNCELHFHASILMVLKIEFFNLCESELVAPVKPSMLTSELTKTKGTQLIEFYLSSNSASMWSMALNYSPRTNRSTIRRIWLSSLIDRSTCSPPSVWSITWIGTTSKCCASSRSPACKRSYRTNASERSSFQTVIDRLRRSFERISNWS